MYSTSPDGSNFSRRGTSLDGVLPLDKPSMGDQTYNCHREPKRMTNAVVGTVAEDPSLGPLQAKPLSSLRAEELKKGRSFITEKILKMREPVNFLNETPYKLDRCPRSMLPRKRTRIELPAPVPNKQVCIRNESPEVEWCPNNMPKSSEMISRETSIPMSRNCPNNMPKQSKYMLGSVKPGGLLKHQDQILPAGIKSWEKTKMTGRCSGQMSDVSVEAVAKMFDGYRDYKQGIQQRPNTERHTRPSGSHGFRSNISNNWALQPSRSKTENISSIAAFSGSKELGDGNKCKNMIKKSGLVDAKIAPVSQDVGSLVLPQIKAKTLIKEESGDGVHRPGSSGRASSFIRMNTPLSGKLENPATAKQPRSTRLGTDKVARSNISNNWALQPSRSKIEKISSLAAFSGSKGTGDGNKCKNMIKKSGLVDAKIAPVSQDVGSLVLAQIKAKILIKEESGDGVDRPGSSGRASSFLRMNAPLSGKLENPATAKQPRSTRLGTDNVAMSNISNNWALQPSRSKIEKISSLAAFSGSKGTGDGNKCKNMIKKSGLVDAKIAPVSQDVGSLVLAQIKAKILIKEESGDGVDRPGSSGRASSFLRLNAPLSGKLENPATAKQPRSTRLGTDNVAMSNISNNRALQPSRSKTENMSSLAAFSESKESGDGDKCKNKIKKQGDVDAKTATVCQDVGSLVLPIVKPKTLIKEQSGDGIQRPGSSGRASSLLRMNAPLSEKLENPATTKQPRSTRLGTDKVASKTVRQPIKKNLLDQKLVTRPRCPMNSGLSDLTGDLDDREEHPAAVNASNNASDVACSGPIWKLMEPFFASLTQDDPDFFKHLVREVEEEYAILINPPGSNRTGEAYLICSMPPANRKLYDGPQDDCLYCTSEDCLRGNCTQIESNFENAGKSELLIEPEVEMKNWKHHMTDYCNYNCRFANGNQNHAAENNFSADLTQDDKVVHSEILGFNAEYKGLDEWHARGEGKRIKENCNPIVKLWDEFQMWAGC